MMFSRLLIAVFWTDELLLPANAASADWVAGLFQRPMLVAAGLPTGAVRLASRLPWEIWYGVGPWLLQWIAVAKLPLVMSPCQTVGLPIPLTVTFMPSALS